MSHYDTPQPISVALELRVADVRIVATERADTTVEIGPSDPSRPDDVTSAAQTRVEYADGRLVVKQPRRLRELSFSGDGGSIDVEIALPVGSDLSGHTAVGGFRCTGALGRCELKSSVGEISVDRATRAKLVTTGDIGLRTATGDVELTTATGEVRAGEIAGAALVRNSNGDVRIREVGGDLEIKAANGDIEVERSRGSVTVKTANGSVRVGGIRRGSLVAETANGDVELGIADGIAAWLDLHTGFGHVANDLQATERPDAGDAQVQVRARTGFGDITIRRETHADDALLAAQPGDGR